jgi:hypothetical protein
MAAARRFDVGMSAQFEERTDGRVGPQDDTAAIASVATVGAALRFVWLVVETDDAVPARPSDRLDTSFVNERHVIVWRLLPPCV